MRRLGLFCGPALVDVDRAGGVSGNLVAYIRILGKPNGTLDVCANGLEDTLVIGCELGEIHLKREGGKSMFTISPQIWDDEFEDVLWELQTNTDFRIAQLKVYETA